MSSRTTMLSNSIHRSIRRSYLCLRHLFFFCSIATLILSYVQPAHAAEIKFDRAYIGTLDGQTFTATGTLTADEGTISFTDGSNNRNFTNASGTLSFTVGGDPTTLSGDLESRHPNGGNIAEAIVFTADDNTSYLLVLIGKYDSTYSASGSANQLLDSINNYLTVFTADPATSTILVDGAASTAVAEGTNAIVTVTAKLADGRAISGANVVLSGDPSANGTITPSSATTDANGVATFTVTNSISGTITYQATISYGGADTILTRTVFVTYTASVDLTDSGSTIVASPESLTAGSSETSNVTVTVKDTNGAVMTGQTVVILADGTSLGTVTDNNNGTYSATLPAGASAETVTLSFTVDGNTAANTDTVTFTAAQDITAPTVVISGPSGVTTEPFTITFTFSENVFGFVAENILITNGMLGPLTGSGMTYSVLVTPVMGTTVTISTPVGAAQDAAANDSEVSNIFTVRAGSPASEFERREDEIRAVVMDDAERALSSSLGASQRMVREARGRLIGVAGASACNTLQFGDLLDPTPDLPEECYTDIVSWDNVPFDVNGIAAVNGTTFSTSGRFFGQTVGFDGMSTRLVFGDFNIQHDGETGSSTAILTGRLAWERVISDRTMLGYFIGGELAHSDIDGAFAG